MICRKKVAKFVYRNDSNQIRTLFGPSLVNFYGVQSDVYGQVFLWIQFVDSKAQFYSFPNASELSDHIVGLSIIVKSANFLKDKNTYKSHMYCELYVNNKSLGYTQLSTDHRSSFTWI